MSRKEAEFGTKMRLLQVMVAIMEQPSVYTKRALAEMFGVSEYTIKNDFEVFKNAGFVRF